MASRRKSRELALQMLFQWEVGQHTPAHVVATFLKPKEVDASENTFARELFQGTVDQIPALDPMLRQHASNWSLERMAAVDRNVIRLALFEMLGDQSDQTDKEGLTSPLRQLMLLGQRRRKML